MYWTIQSNGKGYPNGHKNKSQHYMVFGRYILNSKIQIAWSWKDGKRQTCKQ